MLKLISTALVGVSMIAATPALAQADAASVSVSTVDLDLAHATGRATLDRRIKAAANSICDIGMKGARARAMYYECRSDILANAEQQVQVLASRGNAGRIQLARAR